MRGGIRQEQVSRKKIWVSTGNAERAGVLGEVRCFRCEVRMLVSSNSCASLLATDPEYGLGFCGDLGLRAPAAVRIVE